MLENHIFCMCFPWLFSSIIKISSMVSYYKYVYSSSWINENLMDFLGCCFLCLLWFFIVSFLFIGFSYFLLSTFLLFIFQEVDTEKIFYGLDDIKGANDVYIVCLPPSLHRWYIQMLLFYLIFETFLYFIGWRWNW